MDFFYLRNCTTVFKVANKFSLEVDPRAPVCQWKFLRALGRDGELAGAVAKARKRRAPGSNGVMGEP